MVRTEALESAVNRHHRCTTGYQELCGALANPDAPEYEELAEWAAEVIGLPIGVHACDLDAANDAVRSRSGGAGPAW